ncbi:MAG: glycoside hydrolase family 2, partial [Saprospiraceae bacterium]|nr:glycoside hydrolase family 2 [Saprospiraceae bacterium]
MKRRNNKYECFNRNTISNTISNINFAVFIFICFSLFSTPSWAQIPLPEHPRPDFERADWLNLNGEWAFEFDSTDSGLRQNWASGKKVFTHKINVPFPWGAPLSGVKNEADIAWYQRTIKVSAAWSDKRTFLTIGASDWETTVFLDGVEIGKHRGGYVPFSFELTKRLKYGQNQIISIRVDDKRRDFTLYGKQGYGDARGIWQTIYLEARGVNFIQAIRFEPDIDKEKVTVTCRLSEDTRNQDFPLKIDLNTEGGILSFNQTIPKNGASHTFDLSLPKPRLWTLADPFLYETTLNWAGSDIIKTYFGMRKISVIDLPNTDYPYIALNNKPIYLQLTLDQSYHPDGFYTFPTDAFMKNDILLAKQIGLNGIRTHIKIDVPRKLYWADKLGVLVMADLPNFWGEPTPEAREESERNLPQMI